MLSQASMINNLGSTDALGGGSGGGQQNGVVIPDLGGHRHHHSHPEEGEGEGEPRLPQIWISKSASMELDLI